MSAHLSPDEEAEAEDFAQRVSQLADGGACDVVLLGLSMAIAAVMRNAGEGDAMLDAQGFAATMINVHAGLDGLPTNDVVTALGAGDKPLSREMTQAATVLCAPLGLLMTGLLQHYEPRNVVNSWMSVLLNALLMGLSVEKTQAILRETAEALPRAAAQMDALRELDAGGNTGQAGTA